MTKLLIILGLVALLLVGCAGTVGYHYDDYPYNYGYYHYYYVPYGHYHYHYYGHDHDDWGHHK